MMCTSHDHMMYVRTSGKLSTSSLVRRAIKSPSLHSRLQVRRSPLTHAVTTISLKSLRPSRRSW